MAGHGSIKYRVNRRGEVLIYDPFGIKGLLISLKDLTDDERKFAEALPEYPYIFDQTSPLPLAALDQLGAAMTTGAPSADSTIPSGFTYLGQIIFHDVTWSDVDGSFKRNKASAAFDLDSVISNTRSAAAIAAVGDPPGPFKVGCTHDGGEPVELNFALPEDLPRKPTALGQMPEAGEGRGFPLIPDFRNDDFLPLAQLHLLLIKFYNAVARWCGFNGTQYREDETRRIFAEHVQYVVIHDYLARFIDPVIFQDVMSNGRRYVHPQPITIADPYMIPLEFAAAAGRFGHSMIRESYRWSEKQPSGAILGHFLEFSHRNSSAYVDRPRMTKLAWDWVIDWSKFFDFSHVDLAQYGVPDMASKIDTRLSGSLSMLPERLRDGSKPVGEQFSLAISTLHRSRDLGLASAQSAIAQMNLQLGAMQITPLTAAQIATSGNPAITAAFTAFPQLATNTPIWFYVLKEAEISGNGDRLGPFGSRLVMETLHACLDASQTSILHQANWTPSLPRANTAQFTMADLILLAGNPRP